MPNRGNNSTSILTKQKIEPWQGKLYNRKNLKKGLIIRQIMIVEYFKHNKVTPLYGGMPLMDLRYYSEKDEEYITTLINPSELKTYLSSPAFRESVPKYPEKKKELELLANSLKETDNPVLMMVRLKK